MSSSPLAATVALALLGAAVLLVLVRLVRGPDLADRVVALDLLSVLAVGFAAAAAVLARDEVYLDVALILALVSFLGTVALARHAERGGEE